MLDDLENNLNKTIIRTLKVSSKTQIRLLEIRKHDFEIKNSTCDLEDGY